MPVFFKMSIKGLDSLNKCSSADPQQELLSIIFYNYGQSAFSAQQLFTLTGIEQRKITARLLYKLLHSECLDNLEEDQLEQYDKEDNSPVHSLDNIVSDNYIILSEQQGLPISSLGFSTEQSITLASQAVELLKNSSPEETAHNHLKTLFPVFAVSHYQQLEVEFRLIQISNLRFIITTKTQSEFNHKLYFTLLYQLVRRYGSAD